MSILKKMNSKLCLHRLELHVYLGWPDVERAEVQTIYADIDIDFATPPKACTTDALSDTFCYAELIDKIKIHLANQSFRLLEHLAAEIYQLIIKQLPENTKVLVMLTKFPQIEGLTGGASFSYGDA